MPELKLLLLQMAVILVATRLMSAAFRFAGQPGVVGEMAAGILLGPSLLGRISPATMNALFPVTGLGPLYALSQLGLVLFMFMVGLEVRPGAIRGSAKSVIFASQASIIAPVLCGGALAWVLYPRLGSGAPKLPFVLFLGTAMGVTAFPVLARILADRKLTHTRAGMFALSCAAVDDLAAWCLLAVITVVVRPEASLTPLPLRFAALGLYILAMVFLVRPALRRLLPASQPLSLAGFGAVLILLLASARATEALAVHAFFGAFLAGVIMPKDGKVEAELRGRLEWLTLVLLLPLYFAYTGLRTSVGLLNTADAWLKCALILLVAVGSKLLVTMLSVRVSGMPWRESLAIGVLVNTRGLVEFVVLNAGLDLHIISPALFSMMVIMALATTLMTAPLIDRIMTG
jgi:Kef-type K+ transport system membrane component KefB